MNENDEGGWGTPDAPSKPWHRVACAVILVTLSWAVVFKFCLRSY